MPLISRERLIAGMAAGLLLLAPWTAFPAPDAEGEVTFTEPNGFYTAVKTFKVYTDINPDNPLPLPGNFTYVYTVTNLPGSILSLVGYDLEVPVASVTAAGFIDGLGVEPNATLVGTTVVEWEFLVDLIDPGETSEELYVQSPFQPSSTNDNMGADNPSSIGGQFALDTPGTCTGPLFPPEVVGEPMPCTIGFWKNRAAGKSGLLQFFPDPDFDGLVTDAVALSGGVFVDEADLLAHLGSKGKRTLEERGKQQLAALLLNLAAGDAFPDNQKCKLFEGNDITSNECDDTTVGDAVATILTDIAAGHSCADDLNNGIGVE